MLLGIAVAYRRPLWPPMTDPTTVLTPLGPIVMAPGRRGSGSASGLRVSPVSGRIRVTFMSRMIGHSERSSFATRRAGILKPTAVSCRPGMIGLGNKAISDEIRKFGYPPVRLKLPHTSSLVSYVCGSRGVRLTPGRLGGELWRRPLGAVGP